MSEIEDIFRFVIVAKLTEEQVMKIVKQIEKQIEVIKAFYHTDEETIFREETEQLYNELAPYGLLQFVRSGRISVTKSPMKITHILKEFSK